MNTLEQFKDHGISASCHFADDTASGEWRLGYAQQARALKLFDAHPGLQNEMRVIAKGFLWSLKSVRPESHSQDDRTLSDGKVKTATGFAEDSTTTDLSDFPADLGS